MFADKLIKNLASKNSSLEIGVRYGSSSGEKEERTLLEALTKPIEGHMCQFFDFGRINPEGVMSEYEAAFPAWCEGFLKLPAPICFFEFCASLSSQEMQKALSKSERDHLQKFMPGGLTQVNHGGYFLAESYYTDHEAFGVHIYAFGSNAKTNKIWETGQTELLYGENNGAGLRIPITDLSSELMAQPKEGEDAVWALAIPLFVMLGRLNAEGIEKSVVLPPEKLNRRRKKRKQPELVTHTTVRVAPYRAPLGRSGPREGEDFTPPRYHFRRGHIRRFQNGEKTWVRSCFVGSPTDGSVQHDYVVNA
jgi:hypothetical protein